jgi:N-acetylmuramoyl-L-alanine amidase
MFIRTQIILIIGLFLTLNSSKSFSQENEISPSSVGINTIVIDPGHGGYDPGCHGADALEKNVALSIGLKLGEYIKKRFPEVKVIFTRKTDVFVELNERAQIANTNHADLFICIHANSGPEAAFGAETYVLGLHRTEAQQKVAERENSTIYLENDNGQKYKDFDLSPDAIIARQLQLSVFLDQSIDFADRIQYYFAKMGRHDRGIKQAGFLVLYKTTMPSVLIETGFLTHKEEEEFLKSPEQQAKMANAIFNAFVDYKSKLEGINYQAQSVANTTIENTDSPVVARLHEVHAQVENPNSIYFKVQIETSSTEIALNDARFKRNKVSVYQQDGLYKYTVGAYENDFKSADELKKKLKAEGFNFAFVVAFQGKERINLEKAIKLATK